MNHFYQHLRRWAALLPAILALAVVTSTQGGGGVTGTGRYTQGMVSDFGSVFVNGVEYFTDGATILVEGVPARESDLRVGMVVRVDGFVNADGKTGLAAIVEYDADVRGSVDAAPQVTSSGDVRLRVHGIEVRVPADSVLDGYLSAVSIAAGDRVEVSGLRDTSSGEIRASRLARATHAGTSLTGTISQVTASSFRLGALTVSYDASALREAPAGGLADGMVVRMRSPFLPSGSQVAASTVNVLPPRLATAPGLEVSLNGVVANLAGTSFDLGGVTVLMSSATRFRNGSLQDVVNGAVIEAEGRPNASGQLVAEWIKWPDPDRPDVEAVVTSVASDGFTLISSDGIRVIVDGATTWQDKSRVQSRTFGLAEVRVGDRLDVRGTAVDEGTILAQSVVRRKPAAGVILTARALSAMQPDVTVLTVRVTTTAATTYRDVKNSPISAAAFFSSAAGRRLAITGDVSGGTIRAATMRINP